MKAAFVLGLVFQQAVSIKAAPGDLDITFGIGGKVMTQTGYDDKANAAAIQADGKIVVAGERNIDGDINALLARYNTDGSLDQSFGIGGFVIDAANGFRDSHLNAVAIQADGKIVAAGYFFVLGGCFSRDQSWVVRYNADGSRDTTFGGGDGEVENPYLYYIPGCPFSSYHYALAIQNDGKILVAGSSIASGSQSDFAAARLNTDGTLDTSFNIDGLATYSIGSGNEKAYSAALHPTSGKIILAGYTSTSSNNDFALILLSSGGLYDWNFGGTGKVTTNTGGIDVAESVAFQSNGKIIAAGRQSNGTNGTDFSVVRYHANGSLDTSFGTSGRSLHHSARFTIALSVSACNQTAKSSPPDGARTTTRSTRVTISLFPVTTRTARSTLHSAATANR